MKQLFLLRHAKSSWSDSALEDFDRTLSPRGERDAPHMGARLEARGVRPTLLIASTAKRARRTAKLVARELGFPAEQLATEDRLYLAAPDTILNVIAAQDDAHSSMLVVGHNPGLTELVNALLPDLALDNLPTAGVVAMEFDVPAWSAIRRGGGRLAFYDYPKNPDAVTPR